MIEHVAISGGGPNGLLQLGVLAELIKAGHLNAAELKSVYGTSAGSIMGVILALNIPIEEFVEYIVNRPWNKWLDINVMEVNAQGGMMPSFKIRDMIRPMLTAYGFSEDATLLDAYNKTHVDLHIFTTELQTFRLVDLNHVDFPDMTLMDAVCMSSALCPIFTPFPYKGKHYVDGGLRTNFPLDRLLKDHAADDTVFAINMMGAEPDYTDTMSMMETGFFLLNKASVELGKIAQSHEMGDKCKYYLCHQSKNMFASNLWENFFKYPEYRRQLADEGRALGQEFIRAKWDS